MCILLQKMMEDMDSEWAGRETRRTVTPERLEQFQSYFNDAAGVKDPLLSKDEVEPLIATYELGFAPVRADERPFPAGNSSHELEGLRCSVVMPAEFDSSKERSLIVILHGLGGTETGMASALSFLVEKDFVVLAPKSTDRAWSTALRRVQKIIGDQIHRLEQIRGRDD